ncbi:uncharacterized protein METZ01_LOCUS99502 [marine metagenome]|uniref:Uncharacterized protein n=1 Tax=marine metagenome TaxID=408172 RepID=A0A381W3U7_9ZZZZ
MEQRKVPNDKGHQKNTSTSYQACDDRPMAVKWVPRVPCRTFDRSIGHDFSVWCTLRKE